MAEPQWIADGGWRRVDETVPIGVILEVCQHVFDDAPSGPMLMSFRQGRWPVGVWHWEPEGHPSSTEPSHWREARSAAASVADVIGATP